MNPAETYCNAEFFTEQGRFANYFVHTFLLLAPDSPPPLWLRVRFLPKEADPGGIEVWVYVPCPLV